MMRSIGSFMCAILLLASIGCSSSGFLVVQDAPKGALPNQTLGLRAVVDTGSVTPTERYSWLELCDKVVSPVLKFWTSVEYRNCEPQVSLTQVAQKTTTTGWVAGVVGPVIQTGMMAASVAYAGHEIGQGIGRSGSQTTNTNTGNGGNSSGQSQGQLQGQYQKGGNATGGTGNGGNATGGSVVGSGNSANLNTNSSHATGGNGVGNGGNGGSGGNGGNGGSGGNGGNGGGASATANVNSGAANGNGSIVVGH